MEQLRERIKALMSENESIMANAMLIKTDRAIHLYGIAKREQVAYQKVLDEMDSIVAGRVAQESKGVQNG